MAPTKRSDKPTKKVVAKKGKTKTKATKVKDVLVPSTSGNTWTPEENTALLAACRQNPPPKPPPKGIDKADWQDIRTTLRSGREVRTLKIHWEWLVSVLSCGLDPIRQYNHWYILEARGTPRDNHWSKDFAKTPRKFSQEKMDEAHEIVRQERAAAGQRRPEREKFESDGEPTRDRARAPSPVNVKEEIKKESGIFDNAAPEPQPVPVKEGPHSPQRTTTAAK
ncbi:hypothetical protein JCM11641_004397 [Rhodosporidiobolus odoratus]